VCEQVARLELARNGVGDQVVALRVRMRSAGESRDVGLVPGVGSEIRFEVDQHEAGRLDRFAELRLDARMAVVAVAREVAEVRE